MTHDETDLLRLAVRCIDLTTLEGSDTAERVAALCATAQAPDPDDAGLGPVAAVCVYPLLVPVAVEALAGSAVKVASVAGAFPSGLSSLPVRLADIAHAVAAGADEVDIVLNRSAFLAGDLATARADLEASREAAGSATLKVILETGELGTPERIGEAAELAIAAGADMIKTSTGKIPTGATPDAVRRMAEVIRDHADGGGRPVGLKAAGGVRTASEALDYLAIVDDVLGAAWLDPARFRFGASSLLGELVAALRSPR